MMLYVAAVIGALLGTAIAFDKDRNVVGWYCLGLLLPGIVYALTGRYLLSVMSAGVPTAMLLQAPAMAPSRKPATAQRHATFGGASR